MTENFHHGRFFCLLYYHVHGIQATEGDRPQGVMFVTPGVQPGEVERIKHGARQGAILVICHPSTDIHHQSSSHSR